MIAEKYMQFALDLAMKASGQTSPNPLVGAVVVKQNEIIGYGSHLKAGGKHAEVHALEMAGQDARGATLYVTLEPCSHVGKTPPCTDLIIRSKVKHVVIASLDPHDKINGISTLEKAGIKVTTGLLEAKALLINRPFFHYIKNKTPFITLKTAMSLDGKIATETGESQWITGEKARADSHTYRTSHDAILVGVNTVLADNPRLTARMNEGTCKQPIRIILDTHLRTPIDSHVIQNNETETWIFVEQNVSPDVINEFNVYPHVSIIQLQEKKLRVDQILLILGKRNIMSLFIEGGAKISSSFLKQAQPNQLIIYMAPIVIGGEKSPSPFSGDGFAQLEDARRVKIEKVEQLDKDLKITAYFNEEELDVHGDY